MPTAARLTTATECADLERRLAIAQNTITELQACKFRLNGLIVARDTEIANLQTQVARLTAELAAARKGELPY